MQDLTKARSLSKSWDDIFPDDHAIEFPVPNQRDGNLFDFGGHATPARHWRSSAAAEEDTPSSWNVSPQIFKILKEDFKCMQKGFDRKKKHFNKTTRDSLEKDVANLQSKFHCEQAVRKILEQALGKASSITIPKIDNFTPKSTQDLIREIAMLELEVANLEQHLLALYRNAFEQTLSGFSFGTKEQDNAFSSKVHDYQGQKLAFSKSDGKQITSSSQSYHNHSVPESQRDNPCSSHRLFDSMARPNTGARPVLKKDRNLHSSYSQPIFLPPKDVQCGLQVANDEQQDNDTKSREGTPLQEIYSEKHIVSPSPSSRDPICKTPNRLSEDLLCCMAAIYCKLAEPPIPYLGGLMSPSSSSSASTFSTQRFSSDGWTSHCKTDGSCDVSLSDPSQETCDLECVRAGISTVEVHWICVDNERLTYAARMLRSFRSLVQQLERVDPGQMNHEQKLAFWINIHNALMMHAYLAYGIPRNHLKRLALLQKAAYKIGAHSINAQTIEQTILRCRWHRPAKWLESILSPAAKLRAGERQAYAIHSPEPLICFALCCGGRSDPMVRVYTEQSIHKELEAAKREFLQANVRIRKESKIQLPRVLESFARESSVGSAHLLDWICQNMQEKEASSIARCLVNAAAKPQKCIEWLPYDFTFRYVFVSPLSIWIPPA